jgi:hypothetical protein
MHFPLRDRSGCVYPLIEKPVSDTYIRARVRFPNGLQSSAMILPIQSIRLPGSERAASGRDASLHLLLQDYYRGSPSFYVSSGTLSTPVTSSNSPYSPLIPLIRNRSAWFTHFRISFSLWTYCYFYINDTSAPFIIYDLYHMNPKKL